MLRRLAQAGPFFYAVVFVASVLIWTVPFLYLSLATAREVLHIQAITDYLYAALVGVLPGIMEDLLRRSPSLVRPIPWLSLVAVFTAAYGLYKPIEVSLGSGRRGFMTGYIFALILMPVATVLLLVSFSLSVLSQNWGWRALALFATLAVAALVLLIVPKRPFIQDRFGLVIAVGLGLECVKYLSLAAPSALRPVLDREIGVPTQSAIILMFSLLGCACIVMAARTLGAVPRPLLAALAGCWIILTWWDLRPSIPVSASVASGENLSPQTHTFYPTAFAQYWQSDLAPVLRVASGDTIHTRTVDTGGRDERGEAVAKPLDPLTGPFYVEGAMPGDTLSIELVKLTLNRDTAGTGNRFAPEVVTRDYWKRNTSDAASGIWWKLDRAAGVAMLANPSEQLKNFKVPLRPMVGCVGVAPSGRMKFRSDWLGSWGGNMDYAHLGEGVTLYVPVFHPGALVFIGDAHAAQGDGEVLSTGLETSLDVEFKVRVIHAPPPAMPRAENRDYIMAMGIDDSMSDALQHATASLASWIESEYHLNSTESAFVLGSALEYDVAAVAVPRVNVVAKIKKSILAGLLH